MNHSNVAKHIIQWFIKMASEANARGFAVGVSGGVDSAVVSTLCARTGLETVLLEMPIHRSIGPISERSHQHCRWLEGQWNNVKSHKFDLTASFDGFNFDAPIGFSELALSNLRSRLRMCALYAMANTKDLIVAGTGNKIEDYGVGFFTKYGDGGVDIAPIGQMTKTQVWEMAAFLGISKEIIEAAPTDELWSDNRSDEDQLRATYKELEWAMEVVDRNPGKLSIGSIELNGYKGREAEVLKIYIERHEKNAHKMRMPPTCSLDGVDG